MKPFAQNAEHCINHTVFSDFFIKLPKVICKQTGWEYECQLKTTGCILKPTFKNAPYRNSFVPEIDIKIFCHDTQTILHMIGRPVKFVRFFMAFWFSFLLAVEVFLLVLAITSNLDSIFPVFIPVAMCAFGYLICELATKAEFDSVVKAIQRECS